MDRSISFFSIEALAGVLSATLVFSYLAGEKSGGDSDARVLKFAHGLDTAHPVHLGMVRMQEQLADLSGGRLKIDIYSGGVLGEEVQCIEQLQIRSPADLKGMKIRVKNSRVAIAMVEALGGSPTPIAWS
jgi:TRAP-type C4-dicarboxylate transport system substrate-binding protein|tara:strand:+ start:361 stop:750 length:390 start_codon:yes stop_codon:yes gene_type:complete